MVAEKNTFISNAWPNFAKGKVISKCKNHTPPPCKKTCPCNILPPLFDFSDFTPLLGKGGGNQNLLPKPELCILTPSVMCSQHLSSLHWMNNLLISKIFFPQCFYFSKIIHLWKSYICWLDAIRLGSSYETQVILIEMI